MGPIGQCPRSCLAGGAGLQIDAMASKGSRNRIRGGE